MKKIIICIIGILCLTGCGGGVKNENLETNKNIDNASTKTTTANVSKMDYMEKYIYQLPSNDDKNTFLSFWHQSIAYAKAIQYELKSISNTNNYTFDPTNSSEIPSELSNIYDFSSITRRRGFEKHKNFKLTIEGTNVKLSYDDIEFFPTTYSYSDVQELVEKYKTN